MTSIKSRLVIGFVALFMVFGIACSPAGSSTRIAPPLNPNPAPKPPDVTLDCGTVQITAATVSYCYETPVPPSNSTPAIHPVMAYIWHGKGGIARWPWDSSTPEATRVTLMFSQATKTRSGANVIKVGMSIGMNGVVREQATEILSVAMPQIENKILGKLANRRILIGASMGGHNVLRIAGQDTTAFEGLSALCPAIVTFNPFNESEIAAYKARNRTVLDERALDEAVLLFRATFRSTPEWNANNPFLYVNEGRFNSLPIHLSIGDKDDYGFLEGTVEFKSIRDQQFPGTTILEVVPNARHCAFDAQSLLQFITAR